MQPASDEKLLYIGDARAKNEMGIYDRQYYRDEDEQRGLQMRRPQTVVVWLIIANLAVYVVNMFISPDGQKNAVNQFLALQGNLFESPENLVNCWQLLTSGFVHAPIDSKTTIMHIVMNMYVLFLFGRDVENKLGRGEFLRLYLVMLIFCGAVWVGAQMLAGTTYNSAIGASGAVTGVMVLFCLNFPQRRLYLFGMTAIPAWVLGAVYVGFDILGALSGKENVAYEAHLAGAAFGFLYFKLGFNLRFLWPAWLTSLGKRLKGKPRLRVHHEEDDEPNYQKQDEEADRILDKVHREGEESLTRKERRILEEYSRRMKQKHR